MATINEMRQVATQIETETQVGGNTAGRVGGLFNDIVDKLENDETDINIVQRVEITYKQCQIPNKYINDTNVGSALSLQSNNDYGVFYFFVRKGQSFAISSTYVAPSASRLYIFHLDEDLDIVQRYENVVVGTTTYTATEDCIVVGTLYGNDSVQYTGIQKAYLVNGKMNEVGLTGANIIQHLKDLEADIDNDITNLNTEVGSLKDEVFGTPSVSNLPLSNDGVLNANGTISLYEDWYNSDYFAVDSTKQYTYNGSIYGGGNILYYDSAKNLLGACSNIPVNYADRTNPVELNDMPSNAAYIRVSGYDISACSITESDSLRPKVENIEERIDNLMKPQGIIEPVFGATLANPVRIKLLGDSITQGWGGSNFDQDGAEIYPLGEGWQTHRNLHGYCWANMMRDYLETKYHCTVVNNAITGTSTRNIVTRLDNFIDAADDIVICAYGTNNRNNYDGNNTEWNSFVPDLFTIVNYCKERNKTIILVANIPASSANEQSTDNGHAKSAHMNDVHDAVLYVAESTGVECVDMYDAFNDYCINTNTPLGVLLGDGLHPNDNGYDVYYSLIMPMIGVAIESAAESVALTLSIDNNNNSADLDISDEWGNALVQFSGGHIKVKNFDSEKAPKYIDYSNGDYGLCDDNGNVLVQISGGHIKIKNFDSRNISPSNIGSYWKNKKIAFLGDSITQQAKYIDAYVNLTGCVALNYGVSGEHLAKISGSLNKDFESRVPSMDSDVDMVIVFGGTNDFGHTTTATPFGDLGDGPKASYYTFCAGVHRLFKALDEKYRGKPVVVMTPVHHGIEIDQPEYTQPNGTSITTFDNSFIEHPQVTTGKTFREYVDMIKIIAQFYSFVVIDAYSFSGLNPIMEIGSANRYYFSDGLHLSTLGGNKLAQWMYPHLERVYKMFY